MISIAILKYVSALGTPIIALIVGLFGGLITYRQWRTAQDKLKLDLFDRRLVIYQQTRDFLARRMAHGQLESSEIIEFTVKTRVSRWLFNPSVADYLEGEIAKKAMDINSLNSELEALTDDAKRKQNVSRQRELKNWLDKQLYEVIDAKFGEFLRLKH